MVPQLEWVVCNAGALKPQPSCSSLDANHMAGKWMHVETSEVCRRNIESLLRVWNGSEGRGYFHKGSFFPPIWFMTWLMLLLFCHEGVDKVNIPFFLVFFNYYSFFLQRRPKRHNRGSWVSDLFPVQPTSISGSCSLVRVSCAPGSAQWTAKNNTAQTLRFFGPRSQPNGHHLSCSSTPLHARKKRKMLSCASTFSNCDDVNKTENDWNLK